VLDTFGDTPHLPLMEQLAVVDDRVFDRHRAPREHPENPERLAAARAGLSRALDEEARVHIEAPMAEHEQLTRVHTRAHIEAISRALDGSYSMLDPDTYAGPGTKQAALRAAGGAAALVRAVLSGRARRGLGLMRPPGHHAEPERAMGFCLFNNIAVAATEALALGARRVAIVDWDVHHGNGTQKVFESDPRVLFMSLHQWPLYPGTGAPEEIGLGAGAGTTVNLALPPRSGSAEYADAFRRAVVPSLTEFAPELILVSAGFDAHARDPLGGMALESATYRAMGSSLVRVAEQLGHGRVVALLEGGYDLVAIEDSVEQTTHALLGDMLELDESRPSPASRAAIDQTLRALSQ
jgi:acetoin utilization deacetylase AcuC-like enzyme